jgi:predicted nucleic acid-binding protein
VLGGLKECEPLPHSRPARRQELRSEAARGRRLRTLTAARSTYVALPVDEDVASAFAELGATARRAGLRPKVQGTWIAATARAMAVLVYAQHSDFDELSVDVVRV